MRINLQCCFFFSYNCWAFCLTHDFIIILKCVAQSLYLYQFIKHEVIIKQLLTYRYMYLYTPYAV